MQFLNSPNKHLNWYPQINQSPYLSNSIQLIRVTSLVIQKIQQKTIKQIRKRMGKINSLKVLQKLVKWLNKTQGRDKLCKIIQYFCLIMSQKCKDNQYFSLQYETLFQSVKDTRKVFRLFKSIVQYQKLLQILLDDEDDILKIFRVLAQVCFFFYWFFDNISIVYKIKLFKGDYRRHNTLASIFWLLSLLISIPVCAIQSKLNKNKHQQKLQVKYMLDAIKYSFDILPATQDTGIIRKLFSRDVHPYAVGFGGLASAVISTYQVFKDV